MRQKLSVIIPTLQKNTQLLFNLLDNLNQDECVDEIIVIDNSLKGIDYNSEKIKVITPKENLYVNPSWNLGVKEAKNELVAILNDDITLPENFCSDVADKITPEMGCVGGHYNFVKETKEVSHIPSKTEVKLQKIDGRCLCWGIMIFIRKENFTEIPDEIKIYYGDDWIVHNCKKRHLGIYAICNQEIYHWGSLSGGEMKENPFYLNDKKYYKKYTNNFLKNIFNVEILYKRIKITVLGINFSFRNNKKEGAY